MKAHLFFFFSHLHWDHIQGSPFFGPAFAPGNSLSVYAVKSPLDLDGSSHTLEVNLATLEGAPIAHGADGTNGVRAGMAAQMTAPNFPVDLDAMRADLKFFDLPYGERIILSGAVLIRHTAVDHPNGCVAYRVDSRGKSVVYATDLELAEGTHGRVFDSLVELACGADLLVFDAMYTPEEYEGKGTFSRRGWGHSTFEMGAAVAEAAHVQELCLFHHDPAHDDDFMDQLAERAKKRFASTSVAKEGLEIVL